MDWLKEQMAGVFGGSRRRRRRRREQERYREEMQRWAAMAAYINEQIAEGGGERIPGDTATTAGVVLDQVASFEDGKAILTLAYEDTTGRIQQVYYKNETEWTLYISIALPMGQPRQFSFPPNTPYTMFDIPQNARPNAGIDDLTIEAGFTAFRRGSN